MSKSPIFQCLLLSIILCLVSAHSPAQAPQDIALPLPSFYTEPPDPNMLPTPPPLVWPSLLPQVSAGLVESPPALTVLPPQTENELPPLPPPVTEILLPGLPDPAVIEMAEPNVEVWREESESPQEPARLTDQLAPALVTGNALVTLRVQFGYAARDKDILVRPGVGINISNIGVANDAVVRLSSTGECILAAQLYEDFSRSHIIFYCQGVRTVLPVVRATLQQVQEQEALTGGG